ncbi:glyoxalase/bleomycin resistance/extradiol dioxygenase family protein [Segniliparus rugosus]|uniref:glyoxalase/bleomycin resistance/extradiol dioxygenase family protein n=1 Tax=Segniliparus rugosus TaxID=286804 RepID=UPI000684401F|nr:glyoxalase/bleomycin resistance/extradiol dioxygenase family protein [Segniliparus rugosus]
MRVGITNIIVDDQEQAERFYTEVLGFVKHADVPAGGARWLTLAAPDAPRLPDGSPVVQLLLEPAGLEAAKTYKRALYEAGIPYTMFFVDDLKAEHARLSGAGVRFASEPSDVGDGFAAVFDDQGGNLIMLYQAHEHGQGEGESGVDAD